jgi:hypothetical protein
MMKKIWPVLLTVVLIFSLVTLGCGKNDDKENNNGGNPDDNNTTDETNTFELGEFTISVDGNKKGWATNGTDDLTTTLTIENLIAAKYLVLELSKDPTGSMDIIWQGDNNSNWNWTQTDNILNAGSPSASKGASLSNKTLKIELAKALGSYSKLTDCTRAKLFIAYYTPDIAGLGVTKAYLILE